MLVVEVRDASLNTIAIIDNYTRLTLTQNWLGVGVWVLELPTSAPEVVSLLTAGSGIIVRDGPTILFSGPADTGVNGLVCVRRELKVTDREESDTTTITGADDMVWLADRVAHPSPIDANPLTQGYDINTGPATTVIWQYINDNAGPGAVAIRRVPFLTMAPDPALGTVMTQQARWQNLMIWLNDLAIQGGVNITATQLARLIVVTVELSHNHSADVVVSPQYGDLADVVYEVTRSSATAIYMGAQGNLAARVIGQASIAGVRRVEQFADRRDVSDPTVVTALVAVALTVATGTTSMTVTPSPTDSYRYGIDYKLGDLVGIELDGVEVSARVQQVQTILDVNGMARTISVGDITTPIAQLYNAIASLGARINQLERS